MIEKTLFAHGHRTARLEARISPEALEVIKRAAEIQGRSVSDFVITAAQESAYRIIEDAQIIRFSLADQRTLAEALLNPPPVAPALARAIDRHADLIEDSH